MINSKSNLYKTEWLDLVFAKRNKSYGAYELRQHNAGTTNKAMLITFTAVTALIFSLSYVVRAKDNGGLKIVHVVVPPVMPPPPKKDETIHEMKHNEATAPKAMITTTKYLPPKVTEEPVDEEPVKISEIKGDPGQQTVDVGDFVGGIPEIGATKDGTGSGVAAVTEDTGVHDVASVDVEPEPVGGMAAWNKFLQKNMRYPQQAIDAQKSGKTYLTFVVEKDGKITDIKVLRSPGFGMDEEATRVLKLAPAWRPGMQHGHSVRVQYTLPFNFTLDQ